MAKLVEILSIEEAKIRIKNKTFCESLKVPIEIIDRFIDTVGEIIFPIED